MTIRRNEAGGIEPYPRPPKPLTRWKIVERDGVIVYSCVGVDDRNIVWTWFWREQEGYDPFEYGWAAGKTADYIFRRDGEIILRAHLVTPHGETAFSNEWIVEQCDGQPTQVEIIIYPTEEGRRRRFFDVAFNEGLVRIKSEAEGVDLLIPRSPDLLHWTFSAMSGDNIKRFEIHELSPFIPEGDFVGRGAPYTGRVIRIGYDIFHDAGLYKVSDGTFAVFDDREVESTGVDASAEAEG